MATSNQNVKALVIIALLGLFGLNVYQFVNNSNLKKDNLDKENELVQLEDAKAKLEKDYQQSISDLNDMKTNNEELNRIIDSQKEELRIQKDKISGLLKDSKNLSLARKEIEMMKTKTQEYIAEINKLKAENEQLNIENTGLQKDKASLTQNLEAQTEENRQLSESKAQISSEKESISKEKDALSRRYNRATAVLANKVDAEAFQNREGKKAKSVSKAAQTDFIEICFKTAVNKNTETGNEKFYIRVISPTGETQSIESEGSGVMRNDENGEMIKYSTVVMTQYTNEEKKVCGKFSNPGSFSAGTYQIEVFNKGYKVGSSTMKLK